MQQKRCEEFLRLHHGPDLLVLPNAWDVASARVFEQASFRAIGTTSSGIAASLGYLDGERIPLETMLGVVGRIVAGTNLPVNADIERGYGRGVDDVAETARRVIGLGVAGINIEDSTDDPRAPLLPVAVQAARIAAVRRAADTAAVPLVINARIDTWLISMEDTEVPFREAVKRAKAYREAGADCMFTPGMLDREAIARLVAEIDAPLNILATPATPPVAELKKLGVARLSIGAGGFRAALVRVRNIARELAEHGSYSALLGETLSKADVDSLLSRFQ